MALFRLFKVCRRIYHCKVQVKFDIGNHPQNFGRVIALYRLSLCCCVVVGFRSIMFAGLSLEVCRRIYHCKLQVKFDIGNLAVTKNMV